MDFIFYLSCLFFIGILGAVDSCIDYDFWARLIVGKSYFQTGQLFNNDFYSYGTTHEFIDHEWGSSLVFYLIQDNFGDIGLYIFKTLMIFFTVFVITRIIRMEDKEIEFHFLFFFFALQTVIYNIFSTVRCQTFSFLFFVIYFYVLRKVQKSQDFRLLWCLPVLNVVWANLHGGFSIGLMLIFIFAVGEFLNNKKYIPYIITLSLSLLTSIINPYGIKYIYFIFQALMLKRTYITEWQSGFSSIYKFSLLKYKLFFFPVIAMFLYSIFKNLKKYGLKKYYENIDKTKYLIIIFMLIISVKSVRFQVFFTYCVVALCYVDFYKIFSKKLPAILDKTKEILLFFLISISFISHLYKYNFLNKVLNTVYPVYCVEFLKINNIKGNLLTNFHSGSYAAYKLYPDNQVYMDGRYEEVYDNNLINDMSVIYSSRDYKETFNKIHHDILITEKLYKIYDNLKNDSDWFLAYEDAFFALFLNKKYKNMKFKMPNKDPLYYHKTKYETNIDWLK